MITAMGQILSDFYYFSRRAMEESARAKRTGTRFSIAVFTAQPEVGDLPEVACVRGLPGMLSGGRETDTVCRIGRTTIAVLLIDSDDEGSRKAALRLLERMGDEMGRWQVRVLEYPGTESLLVDLRLAE